MYIGFRGDLLGYLSYEIEGKKCDELEKNVTTEIIGEIEGYYWYF